jgi:hypothetical protein
MSDAGRYRPPIESQVDDHALQTIVLECFEEEGQTHLDLTRELLAATDELAHDWIEPLGIDIAVGCCTAPFLDESLEVRPPRPHWSLRSAELPTGVKTYHSYIDPLELVEAQLDATTIERAVLHAMAQPCAEGHITALMHVVWRTTRVRLPINDEIEFKDGRWLARVLIEEQDGARWAVGPAHDRIEAPVSIDMRRDNTVGSLVLGINWDIWRTYPALVDDAVARVLARPGWERRM